MPNPLNTTDTPNLTKKGINMPEVKVKGKVKKFPYTKKGKAAAKKAEKKEEKKESHMMIMGNPMKKKHQKYSMGE